jgi:hypothetical protein
MTRSRNRSGTSVKSTPLAEQRQQRLRHRELARHIHRELRAELSQRQAFERARDNYRFTACRACAG